MNRKKKMTDRKKFLEIADDVNKVADLKKLLSSDEFIQLKEKRLFLLKMCVSHMGLNIKTKIWEHLA